MVICAPSPSARAAPGNAGSAKALQAMAVTQRLGLIRSPFSAAPYHRGWKDHNARLRGTAFGTSGLTGAGPFPTMRGTHIREDPNMRQLAIAFVSLALLGTGDPAGQGRADWPLGGPPPTGGRIY